MESVNATALYNEAKQYLNVVKVLHKKKKFNTQTLGNIACMAAEGLMVSYMSKFNKLPNHHSLDFLIKEIAKMKPDIPNSLVEDVFFLEEFQNLCVIENIGMKIPKDEEIDRIVNILVALDATLFS